MVLPEKAPGKRRRQNTRPLTEILPEMAVTAFSCRDDFILTFETDPDTGTEHLYAMTGRFVSSCMLRKLIGQAESRRDEGSVLIRRRLQKSRKPD